MSKIPAIVFLEVDRSPHGLHDYRTSHMNTATSLGWTRIVILDEQHERRAEISKDCDVMLAVQELNTKAILKALKKLDEDYEIKAVFAFPGQVVPGLDIGLIVEEVCQIRGLPYVSSKALTYCNNKFLMRCILDTKGIPSVAAELINGLEDLKSATEKVGFPLIFKPIFGASSALIKRCDSIEVLREHYVYFTEHFHTTPVAIYFGGSEHVFTSPDGNRYEYQPGRTAMVEAFIEGPEATIECVVFDGEPVPILMHEKLLVTHESSTILEHILIVPPVTFDQHQIKAAMDYCCKCVKALELDKSLVHFEFRITEQGPQVIEINPRMGGFYVYRSFEDLAGLDPFLTNLSMLVGEFEARYLLLARDRASCTNQQFTMFVVYPPKSGELVSLKGALSAAMQPNMRRCEFVPVGKSLNRDNEEGYVGKFWAVTSNKDDAMQLYKSVCSLTQAKMR